jgi:hypothetical protein
MVRQRLVSIDMQGKLTTLVKDYIPLKATPKIVGRKPTVQPARTEHKHVRITVKGEDINGIAALKSKPEVTQADQIAHLLDSISVNEARAIYLELKKLFGGN